MKKLFFTLVCIIVIIQLQGQNNCLRFDGSNDYVKTTYNGPIKTIEFWINTNDFNTYQGIVGQRYESTEKPGNWQMHWSHISPNKQLRIYAYGSTSMSGWSSSGNGGATYAGDFVTNTEFVAGKWYHVAITSSGTELRYYVNGVLDNTKANNFVLGGELNTSELYFGGSFGNTTLYPFSGMMDEVRVWSVVRSEDEIRQNMYREIPNPASEANLIAYYKCNEVSGTSASDSKNSYPGTLYNMAGTEWQTSSAMFGPKNALEFDGVDDYVNCTNITVGGSSSFTYSAWIYCTDPIPVAGNWQGIIYHGYAASSQGHIGINPAGYLSGGTGDGTNWVTHVSSYSIPANEWVFVSMSLNRSSNTLSFYANGKFIDSFTHTAIPSSTTNPLNIGFGASGEYFTGLIDEVSIWNTALSAIEICENMCTNLTGNESDLVAYYNFDNFSGNTLQDFSGNGNDGTFQGLATVLASGTIDWTDYEMSFRDYDVSWVDNAYYGKTIRITTTGKEQEYVIAGNSSNQIFLNFPDYWSPGITAGDTYEITETASDATWANSSAFNTWLSTASNNFSEASNWSLGTVPSSTDNIGVYGYSGGEELTFSGTPTINNLFISSTASPVLGSNITVNGNLIMESNVDLNGNTLNLGMDANLIEDAGLFYGTNGKIITTRVLNGSITPINENIGGIGAEITCAADMGSTIIERHHSAIGSNSAINGITRYYVISPANNSGLNATLVFHYDDSELNGNTESGLVLHKSTDAGTTWTEIGGVLNTSENTITFSNTDGFSWWTAAQSGITLPVELVAFEGYWQNDKIQLSWVTASEMNVDAYKVYKSDNNTVFNHVATISAKGNSNTLSVYSLSDKEVSSNNLWYYYLNEISLDGKESPCSPTICVSKQNDMEITVSAYPNPFDEHFYISANENIESVSLINYSGTEISAEMRNNGGSVIVTPLGNISEGIYFVKIMFSKKTEIIKVIKK